MSDASLTFTLTGPPETGGEVLLNEFNRFIGGVLTCLRRVEERVTGEAKLRHLVADLKHSSCTMTLAPLAESDELEAGRGVYESFAETVHAIEADAPVDPRMGSDDLKCFRALADPLRHNTRVEVAGRQLTTQFIANVDKIIGAVVKSRGTVKGRLEKVNVHQRREFTLYPPVTGSHIICEFPDNLFDTIKEAIGKNVTIFGILSNRPDSAFPERVQVDSISVHPPDKDLPTLGSLRGIMEGITGGTDTVEYIQSLRDE